MKKEMRKFLKINNGPLRWSLAIYLVYVGVSLQFRLAQSDEKSVRKVNTDLTTINGSSPVGIIFGDDDDDDDGGDIVMSDRGSIYPSVDIAMDSHAIVLSAEQHICTREETYVEQLKVPIVQPVRIRTSQWCLEFPPRCSNYKTEMREVMKVQNMNKTRTIRFCCAGYEGNISATSVNETVCKPVCRGGCGRGYCEMPDVCRCESGYTGKHCTQRCDHDHWGLECKNVCKCENGAACDNKSGICHCTSGWTGEFCELPCPLGTFGVMCRKACECAGQANKRCHPQSGACEDDSSANATHVMFQTLNSTIANITHNLDRIAKNIDNITPTTTDAATYRASTTAKPAAVPEVIVIKQQEEQHTQPKIIVHQPGLAGAAGLLENLHGAKGPDVIHVITTWPGQHVNGSSSGGGNSQEVLPIDLANIGGVLGSGNSGREEKSNSSANSEHEANLLTTLLVILLILMVATSVGFLYIYRRYHWHKERVEAVIAARHGSLSATEMGGGGLSVDSLTMGTATDSLGKKFLKPLPDLPAFTQGVRNKLEDHAYYDSPPPSQHSSIESPPYAYARKESLYSVVAPKSRKGSPDSHLYDEIRYQHEQQLQQHAKRANLYPPPPRPPPTSHYHNHNSQQSHHQSHVSHLVIPPQNPQFLQVPSMSHRIAHL